MDRSDFDDQLDTLLSEAERLIPKENLPDLPFIPDAPDVPDWYEFENALWDKGEEIRQLILAGKKKPNKGQINRICDICANPFAKRGRQSFVMLLGKTCYAEYSPVIAPFLSDGDIDGHVADTLYKMGVPDYISQMQPLTKHNRAWIRNIAKKYISNYC